eukprot:TRINITY_DN5428_c0_g1_i3.p1 TRINITY_DN5428_c0_g1~~TRINITY_DN5428_c0_g1_i3.p1  ORF type:complete len:505 (-),score=164.41 TRINITY_DN5428_c0_g1_i3:158-1573(-)
MGVVSKDPTELGRGWKFQAAIVAPVDEALLTYLREETTYSCNRDLAEESDSEEDQDSQEGAPKKAPKKGASKDEAPPPAATPESTLDRALQKRTKKEDQAWIEEQIAAMKAPRSEAPVEKKPWWTVIDCSADEWLSQQAAESEAASSFVLNPLFCCSRAWGGGWGGQCTVPRTAGSDYCKAHVKQIEKQGFLTHGRIDGPIPPKKREEFELWQRKLSKKPKVLAETSSAGGAAGSAGAEDLPTLTDGTGFSEENWRLMARGAGESRRAYAYRTGAALKDVPLECPAMGSSSSSTAATRKEPKTAKAARAKLERKSETADAATAKPAKKTAQPAHGKAKNEPAANKNGDLKAYFQKNSAAASPTTAKKQVTLEAFLRQSRKQAEDYLSKQKTQKKAAADDKAAKRPPRSAASKAKAKAAAALRKGKRGKQGVSASILKPSKKAAGDKSKGALKRGMPKKRPAAAAVSGLDID